MNTLLILIVIVVAFSYYGGKNVPSLLRNNKDILLGVLVGCCLCFFTGDLIEGLSCRCGITDCESNEFCLKRINSNVGTCSPLKVDGNLMGDRSHGCSK
uniref:Uncharacterized protein n=1 Tax=viral metagenome TaxID=1070528 RepID=A0A6C0CGI0_9ZZZZ